MSTQPDDGGQAFPLPYSTFQQGMTLRDWFAGQAIAGIMANPAPDDEDIPTPEILARAAYVTADAMLSQRQQPEQGRKL